jgi:hypothetical protein
MAAIRPKDPHPVPGTLGTRAGRENSRAGCIARLSADFGSGARFGGEGLG